MPRAREDWTGIHKHNAGWRAVVSRGPLPKLKRWFPRSTPVSVMQKWRQTEQAKWRLDKPTSSSTATFRADVERYLKHPDVLKKPTYSERRQQLTRWAEEFGDRRRSEITEAQVRRIRDKWATEPRSLMDGRPLSAGRVNRLMATLSNLWTTLDGRSTFNPCRQIAPLVESQGQVRDIPREDLQKIIAAMPSDKGRALRGQPRPTESKTRARVMVLATTGLPSGTLMKLTPADVDLDKRLVYRPERHKGSGVDRSAQPLTKAAVDAFREFARLDCWGKFSRSSVRTSLKLAAKKAGITRLIRPYDLRHTFLTELAKASKDEVAVMHIAQHSSIQTTRRYTRGSTPERAFAAVEALERMQNPAKKAGKSKAKKTTRKVDLSRLNVTPKSVH